MGSNPTLSAKSRQPTNLQPQCFSETVEGTVLEVGASKRDMSKIWAELSKRRVWRGAAAYLVVAWLVLQVADVVFPALRLPDWSMTALLGLIAAGFPVALMLSWVFDITPAGIKRTEADDRGSQSQAAHADQSIAVLPFADVGLERQYEYFCDGLTEELLNVLTRIPGLRVASRTSCFAFKGAHADVPTVAERLGVRHILEGSVRKSGQKMKITVQLIEVASDSLLWSEVYERQLDDIFVIQEDISTHVLAALKLKLAPDTQLNVRTRDAKAYELYLRGRGLAMTYSEQSQAPAAASLRRAVDRDPHFVEAWIALAEVASNWAVYHQGGESVRSMAAEAAAAAIDLAPELSETYMAQGFANLAQLDYAAAERAFLIAAEITPSHPRAWYHAGRAAHFTGDIVGAKKYFAFATESDSEDWESPLLSLQCYVDEGDVEGATRIATIGLERVTRFLEDYPDWGRAYYLGTTAHKQLGDIETAIAWAERALELAPNDGATRYNVACFFAVLGDRDRALDLLENSITSRTWIENDSELASLRGDPRYQAIISGLPE